MLKVINFEEQMKRASIEKKKRILRRLLTQEGKEKTLSLKERIELLEDRIYKFERTK